MIYPLSLNNFPLGLFFFPMDFNKDRLQKDIWHTTKVDGPNF